MSDLKTKEDYKNYKLELHRQMVMKQQVPYKIKVRMAQDRIRDFYDEALSRGVRANDKDRNDE